MFDFAQLPSFIEWARKHVWLTAMVLIAGLFLYGGHAFIGGYATRFGEAFAYGKFKKTVATYTMIDAMLHDLLLKFNGSRVATSRFHDSTRDLGDNSIFFVSFETMVSAPGVSSDLEDVANLPATMFSLILPQIMNGKPVLIFTKDLDHSPLRELLVRRGVKAGLHVPIHDLSDRVVGMLTISWLNEHDVPEGLGRETMIKTMIEAASRIGGYVSAVNR